MRVKKEEAFQLKNKGSIRVKRPINIALDLSWANGKDVVVYDVRNQTPFVSYYIVASAENDKRLSALLSKSKESVYDNYFEVEHVEGKNNSQWILVDCKEIVIQLFTAKERERMQYDQLYKDCPHKIVVAEEEPKYRKKKRRI